MSNPLFPEPYSAIILGASGGLGAAFVEALLEDAHCATVIAASRRPQAASDARVQAIAADILDEPSLMALASAAPANLRLVVVATGMLHEGVPTGAGPEKALSALDPAFMARNFAINAIGPSLAAKHLLPKLPRHGKSVFAAISAKVGSISDNQLGGWYSYRAAKAALNQLIRTASIEQKRRAPESLVVALHPGSVETGLSAPFHGNVPANKLFSPAQSVGYMLNVLALSGPDVSGQLLNWDGTVITP